MKLPSLFDPFDDDAFLARLIQQQEQSIEEQFRNMELELAFEELKSSLDS